MKRFFKAVGIQFDEDFLQSLVGKKNSGVIIKRSQHHLVLHPLHLNDFGHSIRTILSNGIAKYNKDLDGILLGFKNIELLSDKGTIHYDSCGIHLDLAANFFIFQPEIGTQLQGVVNRTSEDHVGVLVYKCFNVSIPRPSEEGEWLGDSISVGCEVTFHITHADLSFHLPYIKGELESIVSEINLQSPSKSHISKNKKSKNRIVFDDADDTATNTPIDDVNTEGDVSKSPKKLKKRILFEGTNDEDIETPTSKVKRRKKAKDAVSISDQEKMTELTEEMKDKAKRKKERRKNREDQEVSLTDLNLAELFEEKKLKVEDEDSYEKPEKKSKKRKLSGNDLD